MASRGSEPLYTRGQTQGQLHCSAFSKDSTCRPGEATPPPPPCLSALLHHYLSLYTLPSLSQLKPPLFLKDPAHISLYSWDVELCDNSSRKVVTEVWSLDQQVHHHLGIWKCKFSTPPKPAELGNSVGGGGKTPAAGVLKSPPSDHEIY